jgi:hypothetical protein
MLGNKSLVFFASSLIAHLCLHTANAVPGVTLFISDFKRSIVDKLAKDFFSEPSQVGGEVGGRGEGACQRLSFATSAWWLPCNQRILLVLL